MLVKKTTQISLMAIVLMVMASVAFADLIIDSDTQFASLVIGPIGNAEVTVNEDVVVTVTGNVTITASNGTLTMAASNTGTTTLECGGNFAQNNMLGAGAGSLIKLNGTGTQAISGSPDTDFASVELTPIAGPRTINYTMTGTNSIASLDQGEIANVVVNGSGGTLTLTGSHTLGGGWTLTAGNVAFGGSSSVNYDQTVDTEATQDAMPTTSAYNILTHSGTANLHIGQNLTCGGMLTNATGAGGMTFDADYTLTATGGITWQASTLTPGGTAIWSTGSLSVSAGTFSATGGNFTCSGAWETAIGTFDANGGKVIFTASGAEVVSPVGNSGATSNVFNDVDITGSDVVLAPGHYMTVGGDTNITGKLTISTGIYDADAAFTSTGEIDFIGAGSLLLAVTPTNLGNISDDAGTVSYDGAAAQTILADTYYSLTATSSAEVDKTLGTTAPAVLTVNGNLTVSGSATLNLAYATGTTVTVGGNLTLSTDDTDGGWVASSQGITFTDALGSATLTDSRGTKSSLGAIIVN